MNPSVKILLSVCLAAVLISCGGHGRKAKKQAAAYNEENVLKGRQELEIMSDDERWNFSLKLYPIFEKYMKVEDEQLVFEMSRDDFVKEGLPDYFYDVLLADIDAGNKLIKETESTGWDEPLQELIDGFYAEKARRDSLQCQ